MFDEPPAPPPPARAETVAPAVPLGLREPEERVVIDLTQFVPPPPAEPCTDTPADPLNSEIVVCAATGPAPRLGPVVGPVDDGFGSAIPRASIRLSDTASAEANATAPAVGGINAQGGEVPLKIDF